MGAERTRRYRERRQRGVVAVVQVEVFGAMVGKLFEKGLLEGESDGKTLHITRPTLTKAVQDLLNQWSEEKKL
jgi:hypothetical protein